MTKLLTLAKIAALTQCNYQQVLPGKSIKSWHSRCHTIIMVWEALLSTSNSNSQELCVLYCSNGQVIEDYHILGLGLHWKCWQLKTIAVSMAFQKTQAIYYGTNSHLPRQHCQTKTKSIFEYCALLDFHSKVSTVKFPNFSFVSSEGYQVTFLTLLPSPNFFSSKMMINCQYETSQRRKYLWTISWEVCAIIIDCVSLCAYFVEPESSVKV